MFRRKPKPTPLLSEIARVLDSCACGKDMALTSWQTDCTYSPNAQTITLVVTVRDPQHRYYGTSLAPMAES